MTDPDRGAAARFEALSVRDLVRRRVGDEADRWDLALVQRELTWDDGRMRYLLDSLLAGYPIGSLLLCRIGQPSKVIQVEGAARVVRDARADAWQLLDGQQRINALYSIFTEHGQYGSFYLHMGMPRVRPTGPTKRRGRSEPGFAYIGWLDSEQAAQGKGAVSKSRDLHLCLNRWYGWAEADGGKRLRHASASLEDDRVDPIAILREIDPGFTAASTTLDHAIARQHLRQLISIWTQPTIPVEYRPLESVEDVLEAFTRVNQEGVDVAGQDLFFAGVKTLWPEAESTLSTLVRALNPSGGVGDGAPLIDRMTALRVFARLAARALDGGDLVPLAVDRLAGNRGGEIAELIQQLVRPDSLAVMRMRGVLSVLARESGLGFGLHMVDRRAWDAVLAWAALHPSGDDEETLRANLDAMDSHLLGSTLFRYYGLLRDRFASDAFAEALAAGAAGEAFPAAALPALARTGNRDLKGGRDRVAPLVDDADRVRLANANASLILSVVQRLEFRPQRDYIDWDHIYPVAEATRMTSPGIAGRRVHHRHRRSVNSAGNLWALDAKVNKEMGAKLPAAKFAAITSLMADAPAKMLPRDQWWLTNDEIIGFSRVGQMLEDEDIDPAMDLFIDLTTTRSVRMVEELVRRFPVVASYARTANVPTVVARRLPEFASLLGLALPARAERQATIRSQPDRQDSAGDSRIAAVLGHADAFGSGVVVRGFIERARDLGLQVRAWKYAIAITPATTRANVLVALTPRSEGDGRVRAQVVGAASFEKLFPELPPARFRQLFPEPTDAQLGPGQLDELADRLERALGSPAGNRGPGGGELRGAERMPG